MRRHVLVALLAAFLLGPVCLAVAGDAGVEEVIKRQDAMMDRGERAAVVTAAKADLDRMRSAASHYLLGRAYGLVGELEKAREQFDWSIEQDPSFAYPYYGLGVYFMLKNNMEEAERHFNLSLKLDSKLTRAHAQLGKLFASLQDMAGAEREFKFVIGIEPENHEIRTLLAHLYLRQKRFDRAILEFREVLRREPKDAAALKGIALSLGFARKTDEAIKAFENYLKVELEDYEAYLFLESLYLEKGLTEKAIATLDRLIDVAPKGSLPASRAEQEKEKIKQGGSGRKQISIEGLIELLDSKDLTERREAMRYLVELEVHPVPREMLRKVSAKYESDSLIRVMAVNNLGKILEVNALNILRAIIEKPNFRDPDHAVRGAAASALRVIKTRAAVPVLLAALDDPSFYVFRLTVDSLREYSGRYFLDDPSEPIEESRREELTGKWRAWWEGPRSLAVKLDAISEIERLKFRSFAGFLVPLLADGERMVAEKARNAFFALTAVNVGTTADLDTPEGRTRLCRAALKVLEDRKPQ